MKNTTKLTVEFFDLIIIGSGLAGLYSAVYSSRFGKTALLTKSDFKISNSYWAQGGIAAAIDAEDSPVYHMADTLEAGRGLCDKKAVEVLVTEGRDRILDIISMGMSFDKENGKIALGLEGGHGKRRVLHAGGDATGRKLINFFIRKVREIPSISVKENHHVTTLLSDGKRCYGVLAFDRKTGDNKLLLARSVILATGGASGIFSRTTNPDTSTGDGVALAYNAGAEIADMEFTQFHPTAFYTGTDKTFLISEAVRGEGAHLVNSAGERFMEGFHKLAELAPRDVVARAIHRQLEEHGAGSVFLKLGHLNPEKIRGRFSNIYKNAMEYGVDITKDPVPVAPAAHYTIGGIKTGLNAETNIEGLFACGEAASTGVHGANRLASNSLLECVVFGKRAVDASLDMHNGNKYTGTDLKEFYTDNKSAEVFLGMKNRIAELMTYRCGIVRNGKHLTEASKELDKIAEEIIFVPEEYYSVRLKSLLTVAGLILEAASIRKESRGGHIREDFPDENPDYIFHTVRQKDHEIKLAKN